MSGPNIDRRAAQNAYRDVGKVKPTDLSVAGIGSVQFDPVTGQVRTQQDPRVAAQMGTLYDLGAGQAAGSAALQPGANQFGQMAFDTSKSLLQGAMNFDPLAEAEKRFNRLQSVLGESRNRQVGGMESRLLAQGRLDSTGGNRMEAEQQAAFAAADAKMMDQYYQEAQQAQQQAISQGLQAGASGTTVQQSNFQQFLQGLQPQQQLAAAPLNLALTSQGIAANEVGRRATYAGGVNSYNNTQIAKGGGGMGSALGGIAGAAIGGYFGGPAGMQAGATVGSNLGSFL